MIQKNLLPVSDQMVTLYNRWYDVLLWFDFLCPGLRVNENHTPYDRLHKVSPSLNPRLNATTNEETRNNCV